MNIHGIDWNGPIPFTEDNVVDIDLPPSLLCYQDYQELSQTINPLDPQLVLNFTWSQFNLSQIKSDSFLIVVYVTSNKSYPHK